MAIRFLEVKPDLGLLMLMKRQAKKSKRSTELIKLKKITNTLSKTGQHYHDQKITLFIVTPNYI